MARALKKRQKVVEYVARPTLTGKAVEKEATLFYHKAVKRYDLKVDGVLEMSSVNYQICLGRAKKLGVEWYEQSA